MTLVLFLKKIEKRGKKTKQQQQNPGKTAFFSEKITGRDSDSSLYIPIKKLVKWTLRSLCTEKVLDWV